MSLLKRALDEVKQAIDKYCPDEIDYDSKDKASVEKALDILEGEYIHIEEIHDKVHKMRSRFLLLWGIANWESQQNHGKRRHFGKVKIEPIVDFRDLKKKLPRVSGDALRKREGLAFDVAEAVKKLSGKSSAHWFCLLANTKGQEAVVDPRPTPDERLPSCWRGKNTWLIEDRFTQEAFERLDELVEDEEGRTRQQLKEMDPPLTWGEVFYRFYRSLHENRSDETLKNEKMELDRLLYPPGHHYCFLCDEPFTVTRYHPYRSICSRCAAREKQASWRAGKDKHSEKPQ